MTVQARWAGRGRGLSCKPGRRGGAGPVLLVLVQPGSPSRREAEEQPWAWRRQAW